MKNLTYFIKLIITIAALILASALAFKYLNNKSMQEKNTVVIQGKPGSEPQAPVSVSRQQIKTTIVSNSRISSRAHSHQNCIPSGSACSNSQPCCQGHVCQNGICP